MNKSEKIYAAILLGVALLEMALVIVSPVIEIVRTGDWSKCILWAFAPALAVAARVFYDFLKSGEKKGGDE